MAVIHWDEESFFRRLVEDRMPKSTQEALGALLGLREVEAVSVEFGKGGTDGSLLVKVPGVAGNSSVMIGWTTGQLMLMFEFQEERLLVANALAAFASSTLNWDLGPKWRGENQYVPASQWVPHRDAILKFIRDLAEGDILRAPTPRGPVLRKRAVPPGIQPAAASEEVAPATMAPPVHERQVADREEDPDWTKIPDDPEARELFARRVRRGQGKFRKALMDAYRGACCISGWGPEDVLEAAHIQGHAETGANQIGNGLLLRADLHALFDEHLLMIDPDSMTVVIHPRLRGGPYGDLHGRPLARPVIGAGPSGEALRTRWELAAKASSTPTTES